MAARETNTNSPRVWPVEGIPPEKMENVYSSACALLHGSHSNYAQCIINCLAALALSLFGTFRMTTQNMLSCEDMQNSVMQRPLGAEYVALTLVYLVSATFGVAKAIRDRFASNLPTVDAPGAVQMHSKIVGDALKATTASFLEKLMQFAIAFGWALSQIAPISTMKTGAVEWVAFYILSIFFLVSACLSLARATRDRSDSAVFGSQRDTSVQHAFLPTVMQLCRSTLANRAVTWLGFPLALGTSILLMWWNWDDVQPYLKGIITLGFLFVAVSCFHVAKLVRDLNDPLKAPSVNTPFKIMVWTSLFVSCGVTLMVIATSDLSGERQAFLVMGFFYIESASMNLAKLVRDKEEAAKLVATAQALSVTTPC